MTPCPESHYDDCHSTNAFPLPQGSPGATSLGITRPEVSGRPGIISDQPGNRRARRRGLAMASFIGRHTSSAVLFDVTCTLPILTRSAAPLGTSGDRSGHTQSSTSACLPHQSVIHVSLSAASTCLPHQCVRPCPPLRAVQMRCMPTASAPAPHGSAFENNPLSDQFDGAVRSSGQPEGVVRRSIRLFAPARSSATRLDA